MQESGFRIWFLETGYFFSKILSEFRKKIVAQQELYSMGLHTFEQLAKEAGAIYKIRRVVLVNLDIFDEYLDTFRM